MFTFSVFRHLIYIYIRGFVCRMAQLTVRCRWIAREALFFIKTISNEPNMNLIFSTVLFIFAKSVSLIPVPKPGKFQTCAGRATTLITVLPYPQISHIRCGVLFIHPHIGFFQNYKPIKVYV